MESKDINSSFTDHLFAYRSVTKKRLFLSLTITIIFMVVEIIGGLLTNSIALLSDAGHMFTHSFAIGISLIAIYIACKPPCHHKTFGMYRAEVLAAFINGLFLIPIVAIIIFEAIMRILYPQEILSFYMLIVAIMGLTVNMISILLLQGSKESNINVKGVVSHMLADAVSSIGIVAVAIIIYYTGWTVLDPIVSIGISIIILYWAIGILKESTTVLLEMAPKGLNIHIVSDDLKSNFKEIIELRNVHLWTITPEMLVFSAHIQVTDNVNMFSNQDSLLKRINDFLQEKYNVIESTIQIISENGPITCEPEKI
ncbi:MAG: cation diffusion facilitator family transporter [Promethearchaeota archaeon]